MPPRYYLNCIIGAVCLGKAVHALFTGHISMRLSRTQMHWGRMSYSRDTDPVMYWLLVITCFTASALIFALPLIRNT